MINFITNGPNQLSLQNALVMQNSCYGNLWEQQQNYYRALSAAYNDSVDIAKQNKKEENSVSYILNSDFLFSDEKYKYINKVLLLCE